MKISVVLLAITIEGLGKAASLAIIGLSDVRRKISVRRLAGSRHFYLTAFSGPVQATTISLSIFVSFRIYFNGANEAG